MFDTVKIVERADRELQDRAEIIRLREGMVLVVADGAGGISGGAEAAEMVVKMARDGAEKLTRFDPMEGCELLLEMDRKIEADKMAGETTAVIVLVTENKIVGVSAGDSEAWLILPETCERLTARQSRRPLLGSGAATPTWFEREFTGGVILLGSDGLFKYTREAKICAAVRGAKLKKAAKSLVDLVKPIYVGLQDDVAVVLCGKKK